ncbi:hypothetical protein M427DRAFT_33969 [Gonapodya prolifera JEL478]|uniref:Zinc/iron permease n=1 Tax=Gonapodya prolifera (strain JEL478) TaxID=1344416 RepID=A0A139A972_GONPJ|nr:hypothetical protein M427DRAFT_33969 [Gonapodya prolifera JEL478]|eukprot:KXS13372.1 hypothetical protein M427DRAFT_33969 [Gonapodya prolifera JEL478]
MAKTADSSPHSCSSSSRVSVTGVGGLIVVFITGWWNSPSLVGRTQGFAAGVMLFLSLMDIIPEARERVGFRPNRPLPLPLRRAPAPHPLPHILPRPQPPYEPSPRSPTSPAIKASCWTALTSLRKRGGRALEKLVLGDDDGSSEADGEPLMAGGTVNGDSANGGNHDGRSTPRGRTAEGRRTRRELLRTSLVTWIGMALHNLPEGASVYLSTVKSVSMGVSPAMMLHNIPEGVAVASPILSATGDPHRALRLTFFNCLLEPVGMMLTALLLEVCSQAILYGCLAAVAGIMTTVSLSELFPSSVLLAGRGPASGAWFVGMAACCGVVELVGWVTGGHGVSQDESRDIAIPQTRGSDSL